MIVARDPLPNDVLRVLGDVRVSQVRAYLTAHGWLVQPAGRADFIKFFPQEDQDKNPVPDFFPASESLPGYVEWVESLVRMLSQCEQRPLSDVIEELLATHVDIAKAKDAKDKTSG